MKCVWQEIPGTKDERGWRRVQCQRRRCKWTSLPQAPPPDDTIHVDCTGFPHDHELTEWITFFSRAFQLTEQQAICEFVRWRADGADLSELDEFRDVPPAPRQQLSEAEMSDLRRTDPTLAGNRLEAMFKAIGIPTCGGCEHRRDWMNKAHEWLRGQ